MLSIIVAMAENGVIGRDGDLPWHISADLKRFKKLTMDHPIIMGRKTYDSIGRPLPGRRSIVISRNADYAPPGVEVVRCLEEAVRLTDGVEQVFIIGGSTIYELALPLVERLYITQVTGEVEGDVYFPDVDWSEWHLIEESPKQVDEKSSLEYRFLVYERKVTRPQ